MTLGQLSPTLIIGAVKNKNFVNGGPHGISQEQCMRGKGEKKLLMTIG